MTLDLDKAPAVYDLLATVENAAADQALLHALPRLESPYRDAALEALIGRRRAGALLELVSGFVGYPEGLQRELSARARMLESALRAAIGQEDARIRASAIKLIVRSGDCKLVYLLNGAWAQSCSSTRDLAGKALLAFAGRHLDRRAKVTDNESAARVCAEGHELASVLERALQCWELHLQNEVLTAAVWLADLLEQAIAAKVAQPRSRLAYALNALLPAQPDPRFAGYALRALDIPDLRARAARGIGMCRDDAFMSALIAESWLLKDPRLSRSCGAVRELRWLSESIDPLLRLPKTMAAAAMRFVGATGLPAAAKVRLLSDVIAYGDAQLCQAALRQLVSIKTETATGALRVIAGRKGCSAATPARYELYRRNPASTSRHRLTRQQKNVSTQNPDQVDTLQGKEYDELFGALIDADQEQRKSLCQDPALRSPAAVRHLRAGLASPDASERATALWIVRLVGLGDQVEEQVYRLVHDPEAVVRGNAIAALPRQPTATSTRILRHALQDPDPRVQANAIEMLDKLNVDNCREWIEPKLDSSCSRVRANAVKLLLKYEVWNAADVLLEMLTGTTRGERLSALWVVERLNLGSLHERITRMAHDDSDSEVRRRAGQVACTFASWPGLAGGIEGVVP